MALGPYGLESYTCEPGEDDERQTYMHSDRSYPVLTTPAIRSILPSVVTYAVESGDLV